MTLLKHLSYLTVAAALFIAIFFRHRGLFPDHEFENDPKDVVIGIELGSSTNRVGIVRNGTFEIIADEHGRTSIPSVVAFTISGSHLVGFPAEDQAATNPNNTIRDVRSLIGRNLSDHEFRKDIQSLPYDIVGLDGNLYIKAPGYETDSLYSPKRIYMLILQDLKHMAEIKMNQKIEKVVLTVPSYFRTLHKEAIRDAAKQAGLDVLFFIDESVSAAISYETNKLGPNGGFENCKECRLIIYHLGEQQSYAVLLLAERGVYEVIEVVRGTDGHFEEQNDVDNVKGQDEIEEMVSDVKQAGQVLMAEHFTKVDTLHIDLIKLLLKTARMKKEDVDKVITTGSSSNVGRVQPDIEAYFNDEKITSLEGISPDEAVVQGAAIQASISSLDPGPGDCVGLLVDITNLALGIEISNGMFTAIIPRGYVIPRLHRQRFTTVRDSQEKVVIKIYEGERIAAEKNKLLGILELTDIPLKPKGALDILVGFEVDPDRRVTVMAWEVETEKGAKIVIPETEMGQYTSEEIDQLVEEGDELAEDDMWRLMDYQANIKHEAEEGRFGVDVK